MARPKKNLEPTPRVQTAAGRYALLEQSRSPYLERAREASRLTIPSLIPEEGSTGATELTQPHQSVGADCVNNLTAKLQLGLFPPGESFFKGKLSDKMMEELVVKAAENPEVDIRGEIEAALSKIERAVCNKLEMSGARKVNFEALQHLVVGGNGLVHVQDDASERFFPLSKYVVKRDLSGNVIDIVVKECLARVALPPKVQEILERQAFAEGDDGKTSNEKDVELYTWVVRQPNGSWKVHQEVSGEIIPGTEGSYPKGKCPWLPLRWTSVAGEDYGRGRCEEYIGDLRSLEEASKAIITFAAVASKVVALVNEGGTTDKKKLAEAESGDILDGDAADVKFLQVEKSHDFSIVSAVAEDIRQRLLGAFLNARSIQRNAERVTAEEIRALLGELQAAFGGNYAILAEEFQRPLAVVVWHQMEKNKELPKLPEGAVNPTIVTGLDGLGRNADMQKIDLLLAGTAQLFGPDEVKLWVNAGAYIQRRATALGLDIKGLVRSPEEVQAQQQQAQQASMMEKAIGPGIGLVGQQMQAAQQAAPTESPNG